MPLRHLWSSRKNLSQIINNPKSDGECYGESLPLLEVPSIAATAGMKGVWERREEDCVEFIDL